MAIGRPAVRIELTEEERQALEAYARRTTVAYSVGVRARIVLLAAEGLPARVISERLGCTRAVVNKWRRRFLQQRLEGLYDAPRSGAPRTVSDEKVEELVKLTLEERPQGATHWSTRSMAKRVGIGRQMVSDIWRAFGLKPHRTETFQLSTDPLFIDKVRDVVGLYLNPPANALVLSVDEKSQVQALNRTQPVLPLGRGHVERRTPEYHRNGTTTLFAALDIATGNVIGECLPRHRAVDFVKFLKVIEGSTDAKLDLHLVLDNYATHKAPPVRAFLQRHPRFHLHFIPTHSSWLNQVEAFFGILTEKQLKRGSHHSVNELIEAIRDFLDAHNADPTPFVWTKSADEILDNLARYCGAVLDRHRSE
jgi:transposase